MTITITQNFYLDGAKFRDFCPPNRIASPPPPNLGSRVVANATAQVKEAKAGSAPKAETKAKKVDFKRWLLLAAVIAGVMGGLMIALAGASTVNPALTQVGVVIITSLMGGFGLKALEYIFTDRG